MLPWSSPELWRPVGQSGDEQDCLLSKETVSDIWTSRAVGGKSERPSTEYLIKWVHQLRPCCTKALWCPSHKRKTIHCLFHFYIFVIEARLVCTANSMGTSQFIFVFSTMLFSCQEKHQLLNGLSNSSCWSSAIWSISLFLVKPIMWLYCAWNSALIITISHVLGRCTHIHAHTLIHMHRCTCMPLRAQSFEKRKQLRAGTSSL